jgi:hypothetical protein
MIAAKSRGLACNPIRRLHANYMGSARVGE